MSLNLFTGNNHRDRTQSLNSEFTTLSLMIPPNKEAGSLRAFDPHSSLERRVETHSLYMESGGGEVTCLRSHSLYLGTGI